MAYGQGANGNAWAAAHNDPIDARCLPVEVKGEPTRAVRADGSADLPADCIVHTGLGMAVGTIACHGEPAIGRVGPNTDR